jgi:hypothetical protein
MSIDETPRDLLAAAPLVTQRERRREPALPFDFDVVTRRVNVPTTLLRRAVYLVPFEVADLGFTEPFTSIGDDKVPAWHATGRLYRPGGGWSRYTRVDVELTAWSADASELRIRAVSPRVHKWSARRQRNYFRLAHRTADVLVRSIDAAVRRHENTALLRGRRFADQRGPADGELTTPLLRWAD